MSGPQTEAGKAHEWRSKSGRPWSLRVRSDSCAICGHTPDADRHVAWGVAQHEAEAVAFVEQEAVRAYKAELAAQVRALTPPGGRFQNPDGSYTLVIGSVSDYRAAVLALLGEPVP